MMLRLGDAKRSPFNHILANDHLPKRYHRLDSPLPFISHTLVVDLPRGADHTACDTVGPS